MTAAESTPDARSEADEFCVRDGRMGTERAAEQAAAESRDLARRAGAFVERCLSTASTDDDRTVIVNLAGLLRHAMATNSALATEIEHWARDAADARNECDEANRDYAELAEENAGLRHRIEELDGQLTVVAGERDTQAAALAVRR